MAIAEAVLASLFNQPGHEVVSHFTYFLASDGDLMEGISHEACSLAGHLKLGKLIGIYDDNRITIEGDTNLAFSDDTAGRFESYGWHVQRVADVNDLAALDQAIAAAKKTLDRPSLIIVRSHIGYGAPHKQDTAEAHGAALGVEEVKLAKQNLGWPSQDPFYVPAEALERWRKAGARGQEARSAWRETRLASYRQAFPEFGAELERRLGDKLPAGWEQALPNLSGDAPQATRAASGKVLNAIAARLPELIGGSADLAGSNNTLLKGTGDFAAGHYAERNFHFGIREHGMGAVMNGITLHRGCIPYGGTFLIFSDYMRPAIRLAALCKLGVIYVFTHDSIGLGEDGPTHQPIEQLASLRAMPGLIVIRPADAAEVAEAWRVAINHRTGPVALALTRQKVAALDRKTLLLGRRARARRLRAGRSERLAEGDAHRHGLGDRAGTRRPRPAAVIRCADPRGQHALSRALRGAVPRRIAIRSCLQPSTPASPSKRERRNAGAPSSATAAGPWASTTSVPRRPIRSCIRNSD